MIYSNKNTGGNSYAERKKNDAAKITASKAANKSVAEPIKEKAAKSEKKSVKPTVEKEKTTAVIKIETKKVDSNTAKKPAAAKAKTLAASTAKKTVATDSKKRTVKKTAKGKSDEVVFQSGDKDYTLSEIIEVCKDAYRGGTRKQIKSIKVYVKAEHNKLKAYYVVNDDISGSVDL